MYSILTAQLFHYLKSMTVLDMRNQ